MAVVPGADPRPGARNLAALRQRRLAWHAFAGYTRGIILVAAANAVMVGIALAVLRVPLVLPLTIHEFAASFVPFVGSPIAMAVATIVALAGRGVSTAVVAVPLVSIVWAVIRELRDPRHQAHPDPDGGTLAQETVGASLLLPAGTPVDEELEDSTDSTGQAAAGPGPACPTGIRGTDVGGRLIADRRKGEPAVGRCRWGPRRHGGEAGAGGEGRRTRT